MLLAASCGASYAERAPNSLGADARIRSVLYNPVDVIRLDTNLRVNTAVELGDGEQITSVLLGDSKAYTVEVLSNKSTISIKPVVAGAVTNMTVYTSRRAIAFVLEEGRARTPVYRLVLRYPAARKAGTRAAITWRDLGYGYSGSEVTRPLRVWNDGEATYFEFPPRVRPSIFGVNGQGFEITQNSGTKGNVVRVPGVRALYSVRIGTDVTCIQRMTGGVTSDPNLIAALAAKEPGNE